MCFIDEPICEDWMRRLGTRQTQFIRSEFVVTSRLWGRAGVSTTVVAMMALPIEQPAMPAVGSTDREGRLELSTRQPRKRFRPRRA